MNRINVSLFIFIPILVGMACASVPGPKFDGAYPPPDGMVRIYVFTSGSVEGMVSRKILFHREWVGTIRARGDPETGALSCEYLDLVVEPGRIEIEYLEWGHQFVTHSQIRRHAERETDDADGILGMHPIGTSFVAEPGSVLFVMAELQITRDRGSKEQMTTATPRDALPLLETCHRSTDVPEPRRPTGPVGESST